MNKIISQKGKKYFEFLELDNCQYRIFFRNNGNQVPSFTICVIQEESPIKSKSYKKMFLLDEFNYLVKDYKNYQNIDSIQNELMSAITKKNINITKIDEQTKLIEIILNNNYKISFKVLCNHEIYESNELLKREKDQALQANNIKKKFGVLSYNLKNVEEVNKNNDIKLQNLKQFTTKLYNLFQDFKNNPFQNKNNNYPTEEMMLNMTKEQRYQILGIQSDIVHTVDEILYISRWLSSEKATKLDLKFKGPYNNFDATRFHSEYDNMVPCLVLIETYEGGRFGGFTNNTWKGENEYKRDETAFLFSLDFLEKYPIRPDCIMQAILAKTQYFFQFGQGDLIIYSNCNKYLCKSDFPKSYICQNKNCNPKNRLTRYKESFVVKDLEIFLVSFRIKNNF